MTMFETPYGTVDAPSLGATQKWIAGKRGAQPPQSATGEQKPEGSSPLGQIWNAISGGAQAIGGHDYLKGSAEGFKMMGRELPSEAGSFLKDIWQTLNPMQSPQRTAEAGGRVLGKVGDIGMFMSGGMAGPSIPEPPTPRPVPAKPMLALPPPTTPIPGAGWARAGEGLLPPHIPGGTTRPAPAPPPRMAEITETPLASDLAKGDAMAVDQRLTRAFRQAVRPGRAGRQATASGLHAQDQNITNAVDRIIANKSTLQLKDDAGNPLPAGSLPKTLRQFSDAIEQTKKFIFQQYDAIAQKAQKAGVRIDLAPVVKRLREAVKSPEVADMHPGLVTEAEEMAKRLEARGSYSPGEAQDIIQNINQTLSGFWRNPTHETVSRNTLMAPVAETLRAQLDAAIKDASGPGYQALRHQYGALRDVEKDLANAVRSQLNRAPGGRAGHFGDLAASEEFLRGVFTVKPSAILRAGLIKAAQLLNRHLESPNRAVARMFEKRASGSQPMMGMPNMGPMMPRPGSLRPTSPQAAMLPQAAGLAGLPSMPRPTGDRSMVGQ